MNKCRRIPLANATRAVSVIRFACAVSMLALFAAWAFPQDAGDKAVGVWKMNTQRSNPPGPNVPTRATMTVQKQGTDSYREIFDIVFKDGQPRHIDSVRTYDGKWRPIEGEAGLMEACETLDANTERCTQKRDGTVVLEILARISEDGKTRFAQRTIFGKDGKPTTGVVVYESRAHPVPKVDPLVAYGQNIRAR